MGRRKSKKRVIKIRAPTVSKIFDCPFCNHSKTVECKLYEQQNPTKIPHSLKIPPHPNTKSHPLKPPNQHHIPTQKYIKYTEINVKILVASIVEYVQSHFKQSYIVSYPCTQSLNVFPFKPSSLPSYQRIDGVYNDNNQI